MTKPTSIEDYIAAHDEPARSRLQELHRLAKTAAPEAAEAIKWGSPAYLHRKGTILFVISAHAKHTNVTVTPTTRQAFDDELSDVETGMGSVKIPYDHDVPSALLRRMIAYRIREFEDDGVLWK
ncbi:iron chaperone [Brachybacterium tyrofermentans]|uniref:iron chaperone n=1 Tax=Brachybacterium tyrofermentans TaxID=47848 RepID=UPI003FD27CDD